MTVVDGATESQVNKVTLPWSTVLTDSPSSVNVSAESSDGSDGATISCQIDGPRDQPNGQLVVGSLRHRQLRDDPRAVATCLSVLSPEAAEAGSSVPGSPRSGAMNPQAVPTWPSERPTELARDQGHRKDL